MAEFLIVNILTKRNYVAPEVALQFAGTSSWCGVHFNTYIPKGGREIPHLWEAAPAIRGAWRALFAGEKEAPRQECRVENTPRGWYAIQIEG